MFQSYTSHPKRPKNVQIIFYQHLENSLYVFFLHITYDRFNHHYTTLH